MSNLTFDDSPAIFTDQTGSFSNPHAKWEKGACVETPQIASTHVRLFNGLEREAGFQANGPPVINPFLAEAKVSPAKVRISVNVPGQDDGVSLRVEADVEIAEATDIVGSHRRDQRMIEDVVEVSADLQLCVFSEAKELAQPEVDTPGAGADQEVALGDSRIVEEVGARGRHSKSGRAEKLVARNPRIRISDD